MKEFNEENGVVDVSSLQAPHLPLQEYIRAHQHLIIPCHDVIIEYEEGFLLVVRDNHPAKGSLWPIGGRILRGMSVEESLKKKVKEECGLDITKIKELGIGRTYFATDPFGHGKGTDTIGIMFYAKGSGKLQLDSLHRQPKIITVKDYPTIRSSLHPYVQEIMDKAMKFIKY